MNDYPEFVRSRTKEPTEIALEIDPLKAALMHAAMGISGESGELLDAIKKNVIYNKPLDIINVSEELGDLEFYLEMMRQALHLNRDEIIRSNISKLTMRYPSQYSDASAQERADKK